MQRRLSTWTPRCHRLTALACHNVDSYFLEHWPFPDGESKLKFVKSDLNRVTCYYYPDAKDDRIEYACKLLTILFLIDGKHFSLLIMLLVIFRSVLQVQLSVLTLRSPRVHVSC